MYFFRGVPANDLVDEQRVKEEMAELRRELVDVDEHVLGLDEVAADLLASIATQIKAS